jgi:hypothetical protein
LKCGPDRSTCVLYGLEPLPWHSPQTATALLPRVGQVEGLSSPCAAMLEAASGARASMASGERRKEVRQRFSFPEVSRLKGQLASGGTTETKRHAPRVAKASRRAAKRRPAHAESRVSSVAKRRAGHVEDWLRMQVDFVTTLSCRPVRLSCRSSRPVIEWPIRRSSAGWRDRFRDCLKNRRGRVCRVS